MNLSEDKRSIILTFETTDGAIHKLSLPVGPAASEFIGKFVEQCQSSSPAFVPPGGASIMDGVYPTYPAVTGFAWDTDHQSGKQYPLMVYNFGGCVLAVAVDRDSAKAQLRAITKGPGRRH